MLERGFAERCRIAPLANENPVTIQPIDVLADSPTEARSVIEWTFHWFSLARTLGKSTDRQV